MLFEFFIFSFIFTLKASYLKSYSSDEINTFIDTAAQLNITSVCRSSLLKIHAFLFAYDTIQEQRDFFYQSYATSENTKLLLSRDRNHWHYRFMQCLKVSAETEASVSEYPVIYCNAYGNLQSNSAAIGLCLPATCFQDKLQLVRHWNRIASIRSENTTIDGIGLESMTVYQTISCSRTRYEKQWFYQPNILLNYIINKLLFAIVACASVYHAMRGTKSKSFIMDVFLAYSGIRTFQIIMQKSFGQKRTITCIFGLRTIATIWVIMGHSSILIQGYLRNLDEYRKTLKDGFFYQIITNCFLSVDIFFLLSGTLTAYNWFQRKERKEQIAAFSYWHQFYWHRIVRLWPSLLYLVLYFQSEVLVLHYRPLWKVEESYNFCTHSWWKILLFINSISDNDCMPWVWYVGTDFIFYTLSPVYLICFDKSYELGLVISVGTIVASAVLNIITMKQFKYPPTQFVWTAPSIFNPDYMEHNRAIYIKPQYRIGAHTVGILLGYYLANNKGTLSQIKLCCGWSLSIILGLISLFGLYPALQEWHWWLYHLLYGALHHTAWAIAISWLIFVCHNGYAYYLNCFFSHSFFIYISKISYAVSLVHLLAVGGLLAKREFPIVFNGIQTILILTVEGVIISHVLGFLQMLIIECPFINIDKAIWERKKSHDEVEKIKIRSENETRNALLGNDSLK